MRLVWHSCSKTVPGGMLYVAHIPGLKGTYLQLCVNGTVLGGVAGVVAGPCDTAGWAPGACAGRAAAPLHRGRGGPEAHCGLPAAAP